MFGLLLCKRLQLLAPDRRKFICSSTHLLLLNRNVTIAVVRPFSSVNAATLLCDKQNGKEDKRSVTISYLVQSCGLSLESARSISLRFNLRDPEKADSILNFLKTYGFTISQITKVVRSFPDVLSVNVESILMPKLEFLASIGLSKVDLLKMISSHPKMLSRSLNQKLIPQYNYLKSILSRDDVVKVVNRSSWILSQMDVPSKVLLLRRVGVPQSHIPQLLTYSPKLFSLSIAKFEMNVKEVMCMGFDTSSKQFSKAFMVFSQMKKSTWEGKINLYKRLGWTDDDIMLAFKKTPSIMAFSEERIMNKMDFLVNKMGWKSGNVARVPVVLNFSLEDSIIPRCSVIKVLKCKGLIKRAISLSVVSSPSKYFFDTYVVKYLNQVPQLSSIFQGKTTLQDLGMSFDEKPQTIES